MGVYISSYHKRRVDYEEIYRNALAAVISASSFTAFAAGAIPDHQGTSMDGIEIGTAQLNSAVKSYYDLFEQAGDQYGVDPNLLAAICMQESSGRNLSYRDDGSEYPAWGIMQIENTLEKSFAKFGEDTTGEKWTLQDRLDPTKAVPVCGIFNFTVAYQI